METQVEPYSIPLSIAVQKLMYKVMKNAVKVEQGFIFFRNRTIFRVKFDEDDCDLLLEKMIINKENVLRYLGRKYIPTWNDRLNGAIFKNQKCIQKAFIREDGTILIHIAKSEPHKIITDTSHVLQLLLGKGYKITYPIRIQFVIDQVQIAYQDTLLYNLLIKEFGMPVPYAAKMYEKELLFKYKILENVAKIKKRSVKRKFLRYHVKRGLMSWKQLRTIINITDFSPSNVHNVCMTIREENKANSLAIDY